MGGLEISASLRPFEDEVRFSYSLIADSVLPADEIYDEATWARAIYLIDAGLLTLDRASQDSISSLEVSSAGDDTIDVILETGHRRLALNVGKPGARTLYRLTSERDDVLSQSGTVSPVETTTWLFDWLVATP